MSTGVFDGTWMARVLAWLCASWCELGPAAFDNLVVRSSSRSDRGLRRRVVAAIVIDITILVASLLLVETKSMRFR